MTWGACVRGLLRQVLGLLCVTGGLLPGAINAHAEWDWSDLYSKVDLSQPDNIRDRSAPLSWLSGGFRPEQVLYFSGFDVQRYSFGGYVGAVWSPLPGRDGMLVRLFAADGIDSFLTPKITYRSQSMRAAITTGYRINRPGFELSAHAGVETLARVSLPITKATRLQPEFGMRLSADIWWEPIDAVMIAANLSMTTIEAAFYGRLAGGIRIMDIWTGPEISASSDIYKQQVRVGAHVTGVRYGPYEFSAAAGYGFDSFGRSGAYGRLGFTLREVDPITIMP